MEKSTNKESPFLATPSLKNHWTNKTFIQLKIWLTKSAQSEPTLKKPTTSYGHLNLEHQEEDILTRDILSKEEEIGEIENNS